MDGLFSLLLFAGLFYLMMRFGCGAHMVHGSHGGHEEHEGHHGHERAGTGARDPVCGMEVASGQGYTEVYKGRAHQFCSRNCLDKFDANPDRYLSATGGAQ